MSDIDKLAEIIAFARKDKGWSQRNVAAVAGCPERLVEEWETGRSVPDGRRWNKLCRALDRSLFQWNVLHRNALIELQLRKDDKPIGTNLGDKLRDAVTRQAIPIIKPEDMPPPPEPVEPLAEDDDDAEFSAKLSASLRALPPGWRTPTAIKERENYARELFRQRPRAPIAGPDGVKALLRQKFGVAVSQAQLAEIKEQVQQETLKEMERNKPVEQAMAYGADPTAQPPPQLPALSSIMASNARTVEDQLSAAVQLLREAIPDLSELLLLVNDSGEVDVSYKVREVKVVERGGSLKLGSKRQ